MYLELEKSDIKENNSNFVFGFFNWTNKIFYYPDKIRLKID